MKTLHKHTTKLTILATALLMTLALLSGCSETDPVGVTGEQPETDIAASLSKSAQTASVVEGNLDQLKLFQSPLSSMAEDADLYQEADFDGWTGDGMSYPEKCARIARSLRDYGAVETAAASANAKRTRFNQDMPIEAKRAMFKSDPGDTISVEYFDGPDSTGLNALIMVEPPSLVRFVSLRQYPPRLGHAVRIDQEILLDTMGTDEDPADDVLHSVYHQKEMFGGEVATGTIQPEDGPGPMLPNVVVLAHYHVDDPRFHLLQKWTETNIRLTLGEFDVEDDEGLYGIETTIHWRSDAEHRITLARIGGGEITDDADLEALGSFTAASANGWLESITDTLTVRLGDLEDETDDLLIDLSRVTVFDGTASDGGNPRLTVQFTPDEPVQPGDEPCGGVAAKEAWYPSHWWLVHLVEDADIDCDGSGTFYQLHEYRNGTSVERTIIWDSAGTATVTEERPDGTVVSGTFNENSGEYSLQTTFPAGRDPISRDQHGQVQGEDVEAWDIYVWQDARADTTYINAVGEGTSRTITGYKVQGETREEFTLMVQQDESVSGSWSRNDGASGEFDLEKLEGGGAHLTFAAVDPNGEGSPSIEGEIWLAPDGSGTGTISFTQYGQTVVFEIVFGPDGAGYLVDSAGQSHPLS